MGGEPAEVVAGGGGHGVGGVAIGSVGEVAAHLALGLGVADNGFDRRTSVPAEVVAPIGRSGASEKLANGSGYFASMAMHFAVQLADFEKSGMPLSSRKYSIALRTSLCSSSQLRITAPVAPRV